LWVIQNEMHVHGNAAAPVRIGDIQRMYRDQAAVLSGPSWSECVGVGGMQVAVNVE
jgi:hypothetical protein